jgi:putative pyruvate formate lyase activating enzyme
MHDLLAYPHSMKKCRICPRDCGTSRTANKLGYCGTDAGFSISSIIIHRGEEPVISGNLQCLFYWL